MAENTIDTLQVKIESDSHKAIAGLDRLSQAIMGIGNATRSSTSGLSGFSKDIKGLADAAKKLQGLTFPDLSSFANGISVLSSINLGNLGASSKELGKFFNVMLRLKGFSLPDFSGFANSINTLNNINLSGSGIDKVVRSLVNLSSVNMSGFDVAKFNEIINAIKGMSGLPDVSNSVNRLVSSLARLASAGDKVGIVAQELPRLGDALKSVVEKMAGLGGIADSTNAFVSALANLASAGSKTSDAADGLDRLAQKVLDFFNSMKSAPEVSENTIRVIQALGQLASASGSAGISALSLNSNISQLSVSMSILRGATKKAISGMRSFGKQVLAAMGIYIGLYGAIQGLKKSIDISSNLTEVQNVVDKTFGDMRQKVEDLAKVSIGDFGMSELTVKQIASRFQAMGTAMGFTQNKMSDMSIELTKLAADMASFYNVEQSVVAQDLESVFTGQTRPLRTYGIDLTEATLKEWAMKNGMDANIKTMTQMEKTMLRFQYVTAQTSGIVGDFQQTSNTWANQVRILIQQFQQLGSIIGGVAINAFKPLVSTLNNVMKNVISVAQTIANALGAIFGWTIEIGGGGFASDFEDAGEAAGEMESGTGGAAKNLKEMNKYIAAWHEVNNMTSNDDAGGGGGGGGGGGAGGGFGDAVDAQLKKRESLLEKYKSEIDSLYGLGKYIGDTLIAAMNSVDWDKVYERARNFGTGLAQFLNGLISPELFDALGKHIASSLNAALYVLNSFGHEFDWTEFGLSIATGINSFFSNFNFSLLADTINVWAIGILDAMIAGLKNVQWREIGVKIGEFLVAIKFGTIAKKFVQVIWEAINGAFKTYKGAFDTAPIETALLTLMNFSAALMLLHTSVFGKIIGSAKNVATGILSIGTAFGKLLVNVKNTGLLSGIGTSLKDWGDSLTKAQKGALGLVTAFGEFFAVKTIIYDLKTGTGSILTNLLELGGVAAAAAAAMYVAMGPAGLAMAAVTGLVAAIAGVSEANKEHVEHLFDEFEEKIPNNTENLKKATEEVEKLSKKSEEYITGAKDDADQLGQLADAYFELAEKEQLSADEQERLKEYASQLKNEVPLLGNAIDGVTGKYKAQKEEIERLIDIQQRQMMADAYKTISAEYTQSLAKANAELKIATKNYEENANAAKRLGEIQQDYYFGNYWSDNEAFIEKYGAELEKYNVVIGENETVMDAISRTQQFWNRELEESEGVVSRAKDAVSDAEDELDAINEAMRENQKELEKSRLSSDEYKQALKDLKTDLDNFDLSLSENFTGKLAENGFDTSGLKSYFENIKQGVSASASELERLFSGMGMSLSTELASTLEGKDAETQAAAVRMIMGIESGVKATEPQLITLFDNLAIEIPDGLIKGLSEQGPEVQAMVIELLSKIEKGYGLTEDGLVNLFRGLGGKLPDEIIKSLSGKEASVQKEGIALIGQLLTAEESQRQPLIDAYNALGAGIIDEGIVASFTSGTGRVESSVNGLLKSGVIDVMTNQKEDGKKAFEGYAAYAEEGFRKKIEDLAKNSTPGVMRGWVLNGINNPFTNALEENSPSKLFERHGKNTVEGFNEGITKNQDSSKGVIGTWVSRITNWFTEKMDIDSPSGVFKDYAKFTVLGFNNGLEENMDSTQKIVNRWSDGILDGMDVKSLKLNTSMPDIDFSPKSYDVGKVQGIMQMEMDEKMATLEFENRQLRESMEENTRILEQILKKGIVLDNNEFTRRYKNSAIDYRRRTGNQLGTQY